MGTRTIVVIQLTTSILNCFPILLALSAFLLPFGIQLTSFWLIRILETWSKILDICFRIVGQITSVELQVMRTGRFFYKARYRLGRDNAINVDTTREHISPAVDGKISSYTIQLICFLRVVLLAQQTESLVLHVCFSWILAQQSLQKLPQIPNFLHQIEEQLRYRVLQACYRHSVPF